jgi:hypothetical protein
MAAAAADREAKRSDGKLKGHLMAAVRIYKGTLVCQNAAGYLAPGADAASFKFAGVAYEGADNSAGAAGAKTCRAEKTGEYLFTYGPGGATQALLGKEVFIVDDSTVTDASTTNNIKCGAVEEVISATLLRIRIDCYVR